MDIIGAELVAMYPEHYARVALQELGRSMPVCPVCGTGDCTHTPTEDEMSARRQRTEDKSAQPAVTDDKADPFAGTYESLPDGRIRFTHEVTFDVPAPGGARASVLVAPVGLIVAPGWMQERRDYYEQ